MSTLEDGVSFALSRDHDILYPTSWPVRGSRVAFLVRLPWDYVVGEPYSFDGADLFGNFTRQPRPTGEVQPNGYAALSLWDLPENGGNGDGAISSEDDAVKKGLQPGGIVLWIDENHDGVAQPNEVHTLAEEQLESIQVSKYFRSLWTDRVGNHFRYSAPVLFSDGSVSPSFDVFFKIGPGVPAE